MNWVNVEELRGKTVSELIDDNTVIQDEKNLVRLRAETLRYPWVQREDNIDVLMDDSSNVIIVFKDGKPITLFHVYEPHCAEIFLSRGLILVQGHETTHLYWLDSGEYSYIHTR